MSAVSTEEARVARAAETHAWLDASGPIHLLQGRFDHSLQDIDLLSQRWTGTRASKSALSKFLNRNGGAAASFPGVSAAAIRHAAHTQSGMAQRALLAALDLRLGWAARRAAIGTDTMPEAAEDFDRVLFLATVTLGHERGGIAHSGARPSHDPELPLDLAAVDYLEGQLNLYRARMLEPGEADAEKARLLQAGLDVMTRAAHRLRESAAAGDMAEPMDLIVAVNALLNGYFAAYEIDELNRDHAYPTARMVADLIARPLTLRAAKRVGEMQKDPRVLFNAASAAGLARQTRQAERMLIDAAKLDGFVGDNVADWHADWMIQPLSDSPELADALTHLRTRASK